MVLIFNFYNNSSTKHACRSSAYTFKKLCDCDDVPACPPNILVHIKIDNKFLVFSQKKYGLISEKLATVGGLFDMGESPSDCANRELLEETGLLSENLFSLGEYRVQADRGGGLLYPFFAKNCVSAKNNKKLSDDYEKQQKILISFDELKQSAKDTKFGEVQWLATVVLSILKILRNSSDF